MNTNTVIGRVRVVKECRLNELLAARANPAAYLGQCEKDYTRTCSWAAAAQIAYEGGRPAYYPSRFPLAAAS